MTNRVELVSSARLRILHLIIANGEMTGRQLLERDQTLSGKGVYVTLVRLERAKLLKSRKEERSPQPGPSRRLYSATKLAKETVMRAVKIASGDFGSD